MWPRGSLWKLEWRRAAVWLAFVLRADEGRPGRGRDDATNEDGPRRSGCGGICGARRLSVGGRPTHHSVAEAHDDERLPDTEPDPVRFPQ